MWKKLKKNSNTSLMLFTAPFLFMFIVFFIAPFMVGIGMSFTNSNGFTNNYDFVGLSNYLELFREDAKFLSSLWITIVFAVLTVIIGNLFSLVLAFVIESGVKGKNAFRTLYFLPYIFALVIIGFVWKFIYVQWIPEFAKAFHLPFLNQDYLGNPKIALYAAVAMQIWYNTGYYLVIYIAGIQSIDTTLVEAARVDGANRWSLYTKIMIPMLIPSISICLFTGIASSFKAFDSILSLTGGGPGFATEVLALNIYYDAMGDAQRYGYGMAKAIVMAILIFAVTVLQQKYFRSKEVEA